MKKYLLTALLIFAASNAFATIAGSKHDLSSGGTNTYKGASDQICKYCHVPHNAIVPQALWSRAASGAVTKFYTNPGSLDSTVPTSITKTQSTACLSCHNVTPSAGPDASTALGGTGAIGGNATINDTTNGLSNDHPIAFLYDGALVTKDTATGGVVGLQTPSGDIVNNGAGNPLPLYGGTMECASCHAVHGINGGSGNIPSFLRTTAKGSAICLKCHIK